MTGGPDGAQTAGFARYLVRSNSPLSLESYRMYILPTGGPARMDHSLVMRIRPFFSVYRRRKQNTSGPINPWGPISVVFYHLGVLPKLRFGPATPSVDENLRDRQQFSTSLKKSTKLQTRIGLQFCTNCAHTLTSFHTISVSRKDTGACRLHVHCC